MGYFKVNGSAACSVSASGVLAYQTVVAARSLLLWFDRSGKELGPLGSPADYLHVRISPDGQRVAIVRHRVEDLTIPYWSYKMTIMSNQRASTFNVAEAKAHFSDLVRKAAAGEEVIIAKDNKPLVKLVPLAKKRSRRQPGSAKGRVRLSADFDKTPQDFQDYV